MNALVLLLLFWSQGIPVQPTQAGTIKGVLKDSAGKPAVGIRVAAVPRPDSLEELTGNAGAMSSQGETDEQGRYTIDGVPPGRYFVAAGLVNFPTYYPGTQAMAEGKFIVVPAGETVSGIDFALKDSSGGRIIGTGGGQGGSGFAIPLDIRVENGGKLPIFGGGRVTGVRLLPVAGGNTVTATVTDGLLPLQLQLQLTGQSASVDYRVNVDGLPDGYTVKSMKYGNTDIKDGIVKIAMPTAITLTPQGGFALGFAAGLATTVTNIFGGVAIPVPIAQTLSIVLARTAVAKVPGVNVTGQFPPTIRGAFLSGISATIYLDHSFEFTGVQPGRYALTAISSNSRATFAASFIVGDKNVDGLELEETSALPLNARTLTTPGPAGNRAPGRLPLAAVRGKIVDAETEEPLTQGDVFLVGDYWAEHPLTSDGRFEFRSLLPGKYQIEVKAVGYPTFQKEFSIEEQDMELDVKSN